MKHKDGKESIGIIVLVMFTSLVFLTGGVLRVEAAEIVLRLAHATTPRMNYHLSAVKFAEEVAQRTNNRVEIRIFHSGQLGDDRETLEGIKLGTIDIAETSTFFLGDYEPKSKVLDFPYLFRDIDHAYRVYSGPIGEQFKKLYEAKGFKVLGYINNGLRHMINNKRPIYLPKDMKGIKVRSMGGPIFLATFRAFGANPVPMAYTEVYNALNQGVLDGTDYQLSAVVSSKIYEVVKYCSLTGHSLSSMVFNMSLKKWNTLPTDVQKAMEQSGREATFYSYELNKKEVPDLIPAITKAGMKVNEVDQKKPWVEAAKSVYKQFAEELGGLDLIDQIRNTK